MNELALIATTQFWWALGSIILIDIVLAGDNAIAIALVARQLPHHLQKRAILLGTFAAIIMRVLFTLVAVWLLKIPGLMLIGGVLLLWIAYQLLITEDEAQHASSAHNLRQALQTIMIADTIMSLDNVLAIAGAAQGNFFLVILGLLISIPLVIWGSTLVLHLLKRFPVIIYLGAAVLIITAIQMVFKDIFVMRYYRFPTELIWIVHAVMLTIILTFGYSTRKKRKRSSKG